MDLNNDEDRTFDVLRRVPFEDALAKVVREQPDAVTWNTESLKGTGWTVEDFADEWTRRCA